MLIIGLGQIIQFHQDVDKANVSLLLQQLGGDGAERFNKVLPIPRQGLCPPSRIHGVHLLFQRLIRRLIDAHDPFNRGPPIPSR